MARIRTIKPAFFRHERLQDLESAHPGKYIMLVYVGLWTQCDAAGVFPWRPRTLKLDILPFLEFDLEDTMAILEGSGFLQRYSAEGSEYGFIPSFSQHQRITGKEATEGEKHPRPAQSEPGNTGETPGKHPDAQERSTGKDNRKGVSNARAHEDFPENKKNAEFDDNNPPALQEAGGSEFERAYQAISAWGESDEGCAEIKRWKKTTGYRDSQHGPTTDELAKFVAYYLGPKAAASAGSAFRSDPLGFFRSQFPGWLTNAKAWNRAPRGHPDRSANAREYRGPRTNNVNHISSLITPPTP